MRTYKGNHCEDEHDEIGGCSQFGFRLDHVAEGRGDDENGDDDEEKGDDAGHKVAYVATGALTLRFEV